MVIPLNPEAMGIFFLESLAGRRDSLRQKIMIFLGVQKSLQNVRNVTNCVVA